MKVKVGDMCLKILNTLQNRTWVILPIWRLLTRIRVSLPQYSLSLFLSVVGGSSERAPLPCLIKVINECVRLVTFIVWHLLEPRALQSLGVFRPWCAHRVDLFRDDTCAIRQERKRYNIAMARKGMEYWSS